MMQWLEVMVYEVFFGDFPCSCEGVGEFISLDVL